MARIEDQTPPPRLIAHPIIHENERSLYKDIEEETTDGLFMKDIQRIPSSKAKSSFATSIGIYQNRLQKYHPEATSVTNNTKAYLLRTEISRLREEMLSKINALESEMAGHVHPHASSRDGLSTSVIDRATQTDELSLVDNSLWQRKLMNQIEEKLDNFKEDIFQKLETMISRSQSREESSRYSPSTIWHPPVSKKTTPPPSNQRLSNGHNSIIQSTSSETNKDTYHSFDVSRNSYQRSIYEPYSRKSPISHHYSTPSLRTIRNEPPSSLDDSLRTPFYESYQTFSTVDQFTQTAREELSRHLVDQLFPYDDLADANVRGVKGKRLLNPNKIQKIRETIFRTYPIRNNENEEYLWKVICDKINAKCRGVTRTLKRKSGSSDFIMHPPDLTVTSSISYPSASKFRKDAFDCERVSFVSTTSHPSSIEEDRHHSRSQSSSDSDSASVDMATVAVATSNPSTESQQQTARVSNVSCFSASAKTESTESFLSMKSSFEQEEREVEVRVIDEDEDSHSEGASIENNTELDGNSLSPKILHESNHSTSSALDICDQLAEKYMDHFPQAQDMTDKKRLQGNREEFTRTLIEAMFTRSTLAHSNVTGARGKFMLDPVKIAKVRETVFRKFPAENEDEEEAIWKILTTKINTKCRGVKRLMKRKGIPAECITRRYQHEQPGNSYDGFYEKDESAF